ncbi:MAG: glutamine amidotransferase [Vicinamibacterales bacterium]
MHFAAPIPWWLALLAVATIVGVAVAVYRRPLVPLSRSQRGGLIALRALAMLFLLALVCRPVIELPPVNVGDTVVPVLIDVSRSMRIPDADGESRLARAKAVAQELSADLAASANVELLAFADTLVPAVVDTLEPTGRRTALAAALETVRSRYRGQRVAGVVVISDGGDTAGLDITSAANQGMPVFTVGVGSADGVADREVVELTAGDPRLDQAAVDVHVSVAARGFGRDPLTVKVLADGQVVDSHPITSPADGAPIDEWFTVFPNATRASLYTAQVDAGPDESVTENNARSVAMSPAGRRRRILVISGAPGYEHSFLLRALQQDRGVEVDAIVRKGRNEANQDTFLVQAGRERVATLASGFPSTKDALFGYDAIILSNLEGEFFTRDQLMQAAAFVSERGGGLLLMGGRSFERRGLTGTPLEDVLPVELTDRRGGRMGGSADEGETGGRGAVALTDEGLRHPVMRIGAKTDQLKTLWATLPPLASSAPLGGPRPGASVLAVTRSANGMLLPVVAVQKYGRGRSMVFAGEASWRWRMLQPASDRRYDLFWRQAARWLTADTPEPVALTLPASVDAGDDIVVQVEARDRSFVPVEGADVEVRMTSPSGVTAPLAVRTGDHGRASATGTVAVPGLYRLQAEARKNGVSLGTDDRWIAVGDNEREFADARLNEGTLRRLAQASGGRYVSAADARLLVKDLMRAVPAMSVPKQRDLWHEPWAFALVVLLLALEWALRRAWGLR